MAIIWGTYNNAYTTAQNNSLVAPAGTFTTTEAYLGQNGWASDWGSTMDWEIPDVLNRAPPSAGGVPMVAFSPNASGDPTTTFNDINSGAHDGDFNSVFQRYAQAGYKEMVIRPLWEFNLGSVNSGNQQAFISAFQRIANLAHNNPYGIKVDVMWNPGAGNTDPTPYYPGDQYVDQIGIDESAGWGDQGSVTEPLDLNIHDYRIGGAAAFAVQHNKPLAVAEGGVANGDYTAWFQNVLTALNETGAKLALYSIYDATDAGADERWQTDQSDINAVKNFMQNAPAWSGSTVTPPPPPPPSGGTPSPNGTEVTSTSGSIIDQSGNSWSLVQASDPSLGLKIAVNGTVDAITHNVVLLETLNGAMVQENSQGMWYSETVPNDSWVQISAPSQPTQPLPPSTTPSPDGTTVTKASDPAIIDQSGNAWSLVQSSDASLGLKIAVNGTVDSITHNVVLLETLNGAMVQENSQGMWYSETQPNDSWVQISAPSSSGSSGGTGTGTGGTGTGSTPPPPTGGTTNPPVQNGVMTLSASDTNNTVPNSNISIVATTGDHILFLGGSTDTVKLTGGTEQVTTQAGASNNKITTGTGDDTVTLGSSGNTVTAGNGINEITDNAGGNTFVLPKAGQGMDDLFGNILSNGDKLDLRPALAGTNWNGSASSIGNFVRVAMDGNDALVMVSKRSHGAGTMIADLHGAGSTNLQTLLAHSIT